MFITQVTGLFSVLDLIMLQAVPVFPRPEWKFQEAGHAQQTLQLQVDVSKVPTSIERLLPVQRVHYGMLFQRVVRMPPQSTKPDFRNALYAGLEPITV